jgi:hypothetical protein
MLNGSFSGGITIPFRKLLYTDVLLEYISHRIIVRTYYCLGVVKNGTVENRILWEKIPNSRWREGFILSDISSFLYCERIPIRNKEISYRISSSRHQQHCMKAHLAQFVQLHHKYHEASVFPKITSLYRLECSTKVGTFCSTMDKGMNEEGENTSCRTVSG